MKLSGIVQSRFFFLRMWDMKSRDYIMLRRELFFENSRMILEIEILDNIYIWNVQNNWVSIG